MGIKYFSSFVFISILILESCKSPKKQEEKVPTKTIQVPKFNADSAYAFVAQQVKFGPRVPNSQAHQRAANYFIYKLKKYGASVVTQDFDAITWDNQKVQLQNIIASFNVDSSKRILLTAHWDTRPYADKDLTKKNAPFDGADDGASGVGVLLEMARVIGQNKKPTVGVDIILFDGEDWGEKEDMKSTIAMPDGYENWWCLGSQYWAKHKHQKNYSAYFGVLLDMVGAKHAQFFREGTSLEFAPSVVDKIWSAGTKLGFPDYFVKSDVSGIIDDHVYVNELGKIPMIDIVHFQEGTGFGDYHHTQKDNLSIISKETLHAVGTTLLNVVYNEE